LEKHKRRSGAPPCRDSGSRTEAVSRGWRSYFLFHPSVLDAHFIKAIFASPGGPVARHLKEKSTRDSGRPRERGKNSAGGFGGTPSIADELFSIGSMSSLGHSHLGTRKEIFDYMQRERRVIRPGEVPQTTCRQRFIVTKARNGGPVAVIRLQDECTCPRSHGISSDGGRFSSESSIPVNVNSYDFHAEVNRREVRMGGILRPAYRR